MDLILPTQ